MNGTQRRLIFILAFIFLFAYVPCQAQEEYPTEEEHEWAGENYFGAFEEKFAIPQNPGALVSYRMHRDLYSENEYSFEIFGNSGSKSLSASVKTADGAPLYEQTIALRRKDPSATLETIKSQLKITQIFLNEETCPAISRQYDEFEKLSLETLSSKDRAERKKGVVTITLHPRIHTFKALISGGTMTLTLTDSDNRFVKWAEKTRKAFEICTQPQNK